MKKNILYVAFSAIILTAFTKDDSNSFSGKKVRYNLHEQNAIVSVSKSVDPFELVYTPTVDSHYVGFKEALAFKESRGNYKKINSFGYLGKYQFGASTLNRIRIYNIQEFLNNPELQEEAFYTLCSLNKWILKRDIKWSVGKRINGVEITESGILAAAHLAGGVVAVSGPAAHASARAATELRRGAGYTTTKHSRALALAASAGDAGGAEIFER